MQEEFSPFCSVELQGSSIRERERGRIGDIHNCALTGVQGVSVSATGEPGGYVWVGSSVAHPYVPVEREAVAVQDHMKLEATMLRKYFARCKFSNSLPMGNSA